MYHTIVIYVEATSYESHKCIVVLHDSIVA